MLSGSALLIFVDERGGLIGVVGAFASHLAASRAV
jgi:hypothetical protein